MFTYRVMVIKSDNNTLILQKLKQLLKTEYNASIICVDEEKCPY